MEKRGVENQMPQYHRRSDNTIVEAVQWQPGIEHPTIVREYPSDRAHPQGSAKVTSGHEIVPGTWLVDEDVLGDEAFADQYYIAADDAPTKTCWIAKIAGVVDAPCGEDCAAWCDRCGVLVAVGRWGRE